MNSMDVGQFVEHVAQHRGWTLNQDLDFLAMLVEGLETNFDRLGYLQCPCRLSWDDREKDKDIVCPCVYAQPDIDKYGHCFCSLFFDAEYDFTDNEPTSIPERRPQEMFP